MMLFFGCVSSAFAQSYVFEGTVRDFRDYGQPNIGSATVSVYQLDSNLFPQTSSGNLVTATISAYNNTSWPISTNGYSVTADAYGTFYFIGTAQAYLLRFTQGSKADIEFIWLSQRNGPVSVKDFGAVGTGGSTTTYDTRAISSAVAYVAGHNGGKLIFPPGAYKVGTDYANCTNCNTQTFDGIPLPSGIIIEGVNPASSSNCSVELQMASKSLFTIGQRANRITVRDITLKATSYTGTKAIAASGAAPTASPSPSPSPTPTSSTEFMFSNMTVGGFDRGISIEATDSNHGWQCNNIRIDHCTFTAKYGVYTDTLNTDLHITNVEVNVKAGGSGIHIRRGGFLLIENTIGGGITEGGVQAANFIYLAMVNNVQIENTECEEFDNALNVEYPSGLGSTGFPSTITLISNAFGLPVRLNRDVALVSVGNWYCDQVVKAESSTTHVDIYSMGDLACVDQYQSITNHPECTLPETGECDPFHVLYSNKVAWRSGSKVSYASDKVGVGTNKPGDSMSGAASVVEIETKTSGTLPWLILKGPGSTHERWGWTVYSGKLYLQDIGSSNILTIDENGNLTPVPTSGTSRGSLGDSTHKWQDIYGVNIHSGDTILTDKNTGQQLYRIREDQNTIIFEDIRTSKEMMRLDREGNLYVKGKVFQNTDYNQAATQRKRVPGKKRRARR
jgi:hypothetical protein